MPVRRRVEVASGKECWLIHWGSCVLEAVLEGLLSGSVSWERASARLIDARSRTKRKSMAQTQVAGKKVGAATEIGWGFLGCLDLIMAGPPKKRAKRVGEQRSNTWAPRCGFVSKGRLG